MSALKRLPMPARRKTLVALLVALAGSIAVAPDARALTACTAADLIAQNPGCGASGPCTVSNAFSVVTDGCVIDFGTRALTFTSSGDVLLGSRTLTIRAGSVTLAAGAFIDGRGGTVKGGTVVIEAIGGGVALQGSTSRIDVSGVPRAGSIAIEGDASVTIAGELTADNQNADSYGGSIDVTSWAGDVVFSSGSVLSAQGGIQRFAGSIALSAAGKVDVGSNSVDVDGGDGGSFTVEAGAAAVIPKIFGSADGDAGLGAGIEIAAGTSVRLKGDLNLKGTSSFIGGEDAYGGDGGTLDVEAQFGDLTVEGNVDVGSGPPDAAGGAIALVATGSVIVSSGKSLLAPSNGTLGDGGEISVAAGVDTTFTGSTGVLDVSGGASGGSVDVTGGRHVTMPRRIVANARETEGSGGSVYLAAGFESAGGTLTVSNQVNAGGGGCDAEQFCGDGGSIDLQGCDVTLETSGRLESTAPTGGDVTVYAQEQVRILGTLDVRGTGIDPSDGTNTLQYPSRKPPIVSGSILPAPASIASATCTGPGQGNCIDPCPACGNGAVEYPEECDDGGAQSCNGGCSLFCQNEVAGCGDANGCTDDLCDPVLGCFNPPVPDGTSCSDGVVCNGAEECRLGLCFPGAPIDCSSLDGPCTDGICVEGSGQCVSVNKPDASGCDDGNLCTQTDRCQSGTCVGTDPVVCPSPSSCQFPGTCNPVTGSCPLPPKPDGTPCDDPLFCTVGETCLGGICQGGSARDCSDQSACTVDLCDDGADMCTHVPVPPCCGDGTVDGGEECDDGAANSDLPNATCRSDCTAARCGDGIVDDLSGEECDAGAANADEPNACRTTCLAPRCGDGIVDDAFGEGCDGSPGCSLQCLLPPQTKAQQQCLNDVNKEYGKVAKTMGQEAQRCVKDAQKGKLPPGETALSCLKADLKGKVAKAVSKVIDKDEKRCTCALGCEQPDFGYPGDTVAAIVAVRNAQLALTTDIFTAEPSLGVIAAAVSTDAANCQRTVQKESEKLAATLWSEFVKCKKDGLRGKVPPASAPGAGFSSAAQIAGCIGFDVKLKIEKQRGKLAAAVVKKCVQAKSGAVSFTGAFGDLCAPGPGEPTAAAFTACVIGATEARVTEAITAADAL